MRRALPLILFLLSATTAKGGDEQCAVYVMGDASTTCGEWLEARERQREQQVYLYLGFFTGFVTARNVYAEGNARPGNIYAIKAFVDNHCRQNPLDPLFVAAKALVRQSGPPIAYCEAR
jgi:hypothetical protein